MKVNVEMTVEELNNYIAYTNELKETKDKLQWFVKKQLEHYSKDVNSFEGLRDFANKDKHEMLGVVTRTLQNILDEFFDKSE